jgi:predicted PurR-regulated permease PerM
MARGVPSVSCMPPDKRDPDSKPVRAFRLVKSGSVEGELLSSASAGAVAQIVLAVAAVLAICYAAKLPLITLLLSVLTAFILAPIVDRLERIRVPRWAGSFIAVSLLMGCLYGGAYLSYSRGVQFLDELPKYSRNIRQATIHFRKQAQKLQETTETVLPSSPSEEKAIATKEQTDLSDWISGSFSGITEVILSLSFIPFLAYFMLSWRDRTRDATLKLFAPDNRHKVRVTLGGIADMIRGFLVGNLICGLFMAAVSAVVFAFLKLPYFYFIGLISGFLSLVPYLGVVLAMLPPMAAGVGQLRSSEMLIIAALVIGLHVFAINVLFPKVIGKRLKLNPLVVTIALLMWGWIWGAMGLILAIPITGAMKIIFDHIEVLRPFGAWMEE